LGPGPKGEVFFLGFFSGMKAVGNSSGGKDPKGTLFEPKGEKKSWCLIRSLVLDTKSGFEKKKSACRQEGDPSKKNQTWDGRGEFLKADGPGKLQRNGWVRKAGPSKRNPRWEEHKGFESPKKIRGSKTIPPWDGRININHQGSLLGREKQVGRKESKKGI